MELQVVSDTTGMPVQQGAPAVSAVYRFGCAGVEFQESETLYLESVSEGSSGWFDFPITLGAYNFTVNYAGHTYLFPGGSYPDSTTCVTLAVPSGTVTLDRYQFSNYDCAGNLGGWAANATYGTTQCFGEVYLRVLSDSNSARLAGAAVTTAYDFAYTCAPSFFESPSSYLSSFSGEAFKSFTTSTSTEWYAFGDAANSFSVIYGGQAYTVTASQRAGSTCVTLHVPSGAVDTTYGASCMTGSSSSATLQSSTTSSTSTTASTTSSSRTQSASSSSVAISTGSSPSISTAEVANVTLNPWPGQIAVNPVTGKVYVSDLFANTMTVLNASNHEIIRNITLPGTPGFGIAVDSEEDMVFVPVSSCTNLPNVSNSCISSGGEQSTGSIIRIDGRNDTIVGEFPIDVQQLAIDPAGQVLYGISNAYVSSLGVDYLISYDENSGALLSDKPLGSATPLDMAVNSQSNMVYVSAFDRGTRTAEVLAVNETSYLVQWTAPLNYGERNFPLVFDSTNHSVYVMGETGGNLTLNAVDGLSGKLLYSASFGSSCAGAGGGGIVVDPTSDRLYVVSDSENFLLVIDGGTGRLLGAFNTPQSGGEYNIGLNQATHEIYLTLESSSHPNTGYFVSLSGEGLDRISQVEPGFLQRGICVP